MKITHVETLISCGPFSESAEWVEIRDGLHRAVQAVDWPPGSGTFTIYPQSGKKRDEGNGVTPIKNNCIEELKRQGWKKEVALKVTEGIPRPGNLDAVFEADGGTVCMEWETGNVSSSHRALNKMAVGLIGKYLVGAVLVIPSRKLYKYLTDRIGNYSEIEPYLKLWQSIPCENGVFEIIVIEQDAESLNVPRIPKATDGRSKN